MKLRHVHHLTFDKLICAISIICLAVFLVLVLVLKDIFQVLVLVLVLGRSGPGGPCPCPWGPGPCPCPWVVRSRRALFLSWGVRSLLPPLRTSAWGAATKVGN